MNKQWSQTPFIAVLLVALVLLVGWLPALVDGDDPSDSVQSAYEIQRIQSEPGTLYGGFAGMIEPEWSLPGVYSDTLSTPAPQDPQALPPLDPSCLDLGLQLSFDAGQVTGFVDLEETLAFEKADTIQATPIGPTPLPGTPNPGARDLDVGPALQGQLNGDLLRLTSRRVAGSMAGVPIQRQFVIEATVRWEERRVFIDGSYRETIWGYLPQPITIIGTVHLSQNVFVVDELDIEPTPTLPTGSVEPTATSATPTASPAGPTPTPGGQTATPRPTSTSGGPEAPIFLPVLYNGAATDG